MRANFGTDIHLIAEIGVNHEGDFDRAVRQIAAAAKGGASSVKFQYYRARYLASDRASAYWDESSEPTTSQLDLFRKYDSFGPDQYEGLAQFAHELGLDFGLSVFHLDGVDEVESFVDYFKVASGDIDFFDLHERIASKGKPIVFSTGASSAIEIKEVVSRMESYSEQVVFLQCTLCYPTMLKDANVSSLTRLQDLVGRHITGVSDHIADSSPLRFQLAAALGGSVFEKHFSDSPGGKGNDHYHSWGEVGFKHLREALQEAGEILGAGELLLEAEEAARVGARRSLFFARSMKRGEVITASDLIALRPAKGLPPSAAARFVGKVIAEDFSAGEMLTEGAVS